MTSPASSVLFGSDLWNTALEKYASVTHLTVMLFGTDERAVFGPIGPTPLFKLFDEAGYDPGIFAECVRRCLAQTAAQPAARPAVVVSQFHGLAAIGISLMLEGRIVGAAVGGYALVDFSQMSEIQRLARQAGIGFQRVWAIARKQAPVPRQRLTVYGELLQVLGDALLRENFRTRQYERAAAIIDSSEDAIVSEDLDGVITTWNAGAKRLFGYEAGEAIGKPMACLVDSERFEDERSVLAHLRRGEKVEDAEVVYLRKDGSSAEISLTTSPIVDGDGGLVGISKIARDISERKRHQEHRELLINELNHRVKNTLATVQSFAMQTLRSTGSMETGREAFEARLMALAKAHDVLTHEHWEGADLDKVVADAMAAYSGDTDASRIRVAGPSVRLRPAAVLALSMALHELATNAVKYGALSNGTGGVEITWRRSPGEPSRFHLRWAERGGPPVEPPRRRGFGSRLVERGLAQDLGGDARLDFARSGLVCTIDAPLEDVAAAGEAGSA